MFAGVALWLASSCGELHAKPPRITLALVRTSTRHTEVEPGLREIAERARNKDEKLTGFRLASLSSRVVRVGVPVEFALAAPFTVRLTLLGRDYSKKNAFLIKIRSGREDSDHCSCCCEGYALWLYSHENERFVIAVLIRPCPKP